MAVVARRLHNFLKSSTTVSTFLDYRICLTSVTLFLRETVAAFRTIILFAGVSTDVYLIGKLQVTNKLLNLYIIDVASLGVICESTARCSEWLSAGMGFIFQYDSASWLIIELSLFY